MTQELQTSVPDEEVHLQVMRLIEQRPEVTQRELAGVLGVSLGKANYCIRALVQKGLVKIENFRRSNSKFQYAYLLTPSGLETKARLAKAFLERKKAEYEALHLEISALEREVDALPPVRQRQYTKS